MKEYLYLKPIPFHLLPPNKKCPKNLGQKKNTSSIRTLPSVSEFHRINPTGLADYTAGREINPALKFMVKLYTKITVLSMINRQINIKIKDCHKNDSHLPLLILPIIVFRYI